MIREGATTALLAAAVLAGGCRDDDSGGDSSPPPADESPVEAAPEAPPATTPEVGDASSLSDGDESGITAAVTAYFLALNEDDGSLLCATLLPGAIRRGDLPVFKGNCAASVEASIGTEPKGGAPAWRGTEVAERNAVSVGQDTARVTATVTHDFSDRAYNSIEDDVIYLRRDGDLWLIAKPSGTFYRAVGYPEPPLRALTPP